MIDVETNNHRLPHGKVKLEPVIHPGVKDLRKLYHTVESHVRSLSSLGINYQYFGPLLIPIILERLPITIKLQISRKSGKENWNIEQFLLVIHGEISAKENFEYLRQNDFDKKELNNLLLVRCVPKLK